MTNEIFARAENLIDPHLPTFEVDLYCEQGKVMDSWESARHSPTARENLVLELKKPSAIRYVLVSTAFHHGNQVPRFSLEALEVDTPDDAWVSILPPTPLEGHAIKRIRISSDLSSDAATDNRVFRQIRVSTYPDGGLTRLSLFNELPVEEAARYAPANTAPSEPWPEPIPAPPQTVGNPLLPKAKTLSRI